MAKWMKIALPVAAALVLAVIGFRWWRGPVGASSDYGGSLDAKTVADFPSVDPARWVNGAPSPLAAARGDVVFIEGWAPA
jgi:hypothetical protein